MELHGRQARFIILTRWSGTAVTNGPRPSFATPIAGSLSANRAKQLQTLILVMQFSV